MRPIDHGRLDRTELLANPARSLTRGSKMPGTIRSSRRLTGAIMAAVLAVSAGTAAAVAEMDEELTAELVAIEQTKLDPWYGEASTEVYVSHVAEDSTYFDPWAGGKLQGAEVIEYLSAFEGNIPNLAYEIVDPSADVHGDVAIFTYVIENSDPETGEPAGSWYVTKILSPGAEGWEVIHTHYALPAPPPEM